MVARDSDLRCRKDHKSIGNINITYWIHALAHVGIAARNRGTANNRVRVNNLCCVQVIRKIGVRARTTRC